MKKITIVNLDCGWEAVYIENEIFAQSENVIYSPFLAEFLEELGCLYEVVCLEDIDSRLEDYATNEGVLPETLAEVHQLIAGG